MGRADNDGTDLRVGIFAAGGHDLANSQIVFIPTGNRAHDLALSHAGAEERTQKQGAAGWRSQAAAKFDFVANKDVAAMRTRLR
jgi:hypothetical protein